MVSYSSSEDTCEFGRGSREPRHLSDRAAAELVRELHHNGLCTVVLAHLSEQANDPGLAHDTVGEALGRRYGGTLVVATQHRPLDPIDVSQRRTARLPAQMTLF